MSHKSTAFGELYRSDNYFKQFSLQHAAIFILQLLQSTLIEIPQTSYLHETKTVKNCLLSRPVSHCKLNHKCLILLIPAGRNSTRVMMYVSLNCIIVWSLSVINYAILPNCSLLNLSKCCSTAIRHEIIDAHVLCSNTSPANHLK